MTTKSVALTLSFFFFDVASICLMTSRCELRAGNTRLKNVNRQAAAVRVRDGPQHLSSDQSGVAVLLSYWTLGWRGRGFSS